MKNKTILNLIIILGIILGGFYLSSKIDTQNNDINGTTTTTEQILLDTSDWLICRNEEYGYEFKYPKNWYLYNSEESYNKNTPMMDKEGTKCVGSYLFVSSKKIGDSREEQKQVFSIDVSNQERLSRTIYSNSKNLEDYWSKATPKFRETHIIEKKTVLGDSEVWQEKKTKGYTLWSFNKGSLFVIRMEETKSINTVISTFKFIK